MTFQVFQNLYALNNIILILPHFAFNMHQLFEANLCDYNIVSQNLPYTPQKYNINILLPLSFKSLLY